MCIRDRVKTEPSTGDRQSSLSTVFGQSRARALLNPASLSDLALRSVALLQLHAHGSERC
eukprot:559178-Alexandrium_andersonii.AAC.1